MMLDPAVVLAREYFPRGLAQPETGFRFSMDALLLAAFAVQHGVNVHSRALDLGTGCGVVGLALLLRSSFFRVTGLDVNAEMLAHARDNARRLGFEERFQVVQADVRTAGGVRPESMDLVLCNPPYRDPGTGRTCPDSAKTLARFADVACFADFVRAAAFAVKNKKTCVFIQLAERVDDVLALCLKNRLRPKDLLFVHPRAQDPARLVLVRAVKNGGQGARVASPLVLHDASGLTPAALAFCPELGCNS